MEAAAALRDRRGRERRNHSPSLPKSPYAAPGTPLQSSPADQPRVGGQLKAQNERKAGERVQPRILTWWPLVPKPHARAHRVTQEEETRHQLPQQTHTRQSYFSQKLTPFRYTNTETD